MGEAMRNAAFRARQELRMGVIGYEEAKAKIMPFIDKANAISKEKAIKYKLRPRYITFASFVR